MTTLLEPRSDSLDALAFFATARFRTLFRAIRCRVPRGAFADWRRTLAQLVPAAMHWSTRAKQEAMTIVGGHVSHALARQEPLDESSAAIAVITLTAVSQATEQPWPKECAAALGGPDLDHPELVARALDALYAQVRDHSEATATPLAFLEVATAVRHLGCLEAKLADGVVASGTGSPLAVYFAGLRAVRAGAPWSALTTRRDRVLRYLAARARSTRRAPRRRERPAVLWTWRERLRYALGGDSWRWTWGGRLRSVVILMAAALSLGGAALWIRAELEAQRVEQQLIRPLTMVDNDASQGSTR